jgi:hypothetical protein
MVIVGGLWSVAWIVPIYETRFAASSRFGGRDGQLKRTA